MGKPETPIEKIEQIRNLKTAGYCNKFIEEELHVSGSTLYKACTDSRYGPKITANREKKENVPIPVKNQNIRNIVTDMVSKGYGTNYGRYMADKKEKKKTVSPRKSDTVHNRNIGCRTMSLLCQTIYYIVNSLKEK